MVFEMKIFKIPITARYVILTTVLGFVIIKLLNIGVSYSVCDTRIAEGDNTQDTEKVSDPRDSSKINEKVLMVLKDKVDFNEKARCFDSHQQLAQNTSEDTQELINEDSKNNSVFYMLSSFSKVLSFLKIKTFVIEPKILYCMLETKHQDLLRNRNFNISSSYGSSDIVTLGVFEDDALILQNKEKFQKFQNAGFQPYFATTPLPPWMKKNDIGLNNLKFTSHIFFFYYELIVHVVVFYRRNSYLWHAALELDENLNIPLKKELLFADYDSAYENFSLDPIVNGSIKLSNIYIPSNLQYFLFQIPSSRFLECNLMNSINIRNQPSGSSLEKFTRKTFIALDELKKLFNQLLLHFWIFSGTMLGWYRQCGLIPYTSDIDFGAWASEVDDLDYLIQYFQNNTKLTIRERMGMLEEALEFQLRYDGLRVDVFFMYKINNGSWASGHRPSRGYYFRYYYPHFNLCSAELLGQKVQVPCETEEVIKTEYGPNWMKPVSKWHYELSIFNRGPNIYWDEKRRSKAFEEF